MAYFNNPLTKPQGFFSSQPGGLFGPPQQEGFAGFLSDPRVSIGMAIAEGQPLGQALLGGALQAKQIETAMFPEAEERKIIVDANGRQRYVDTGEFVFPDLESTPDAVETFTLLTEIEKSNAGLDPTRTYQKSDISGKITQVGTSPTVTIEGDEPGQTKEQELIGEYYGETFANIAKRGDEAFKGNQDIEIMEQLLENTDFTTGSFGEFRTSAENIASEFGINLDVQNVPAAEAYRSLSGRVVLSNLQYTKGAVSDREMNFFGSIAPGLTMSKEGNRLVLDIAKRKNANEVRYRDAAINWIEENDSLRAKNKDGKTWSEFTLEFQKNNPLYSPEEVEVMKNLSEQIDPQFAGNDIIENNGIKYIEIGGDFYPI